MNFLLDLVLKSPIDQLSSYLNSESPDISTFIDSNNLTILHHCVAHNKEPQMRVILHYSKTLPKLTYSSWINNYSKDGYTPLLFAVQKGYFDCVFLLIQFDADIYSKTNMGLDVIHLCAQNNNSLLLSFFYERNFYIHTRDNKGGTALHWAAYMGSFSVLNLLLTLGADKNAQDGDGRTALHLAVISAHEKVVRKLLVYGIDVNIKDKRGRTALNCAMESSASALIKMLKPLSMYDRIICNSQVREPSKDMKHMTALLLFITFSFCFTMTFCARKNDPASIVFLVLVAVVIVNMLILITKDPGFVRKGKNIGFFELYKKSSNDVCTECKIIRPPRSRHCYYCGRCVFRYDHHCQWINNCVGLYNNNYFIVFLVLLLVLCVVVSYIAISDFMFPEDEGFVRDSTAIPPAACALLAACVALYPISVLLVIQCKNYSANKTSSERLSKDKKGRSSRLSLVNCWKMACNKV